MNEWLSMIFVLLGSLFILTSAIGVVRLPDVLCRSHAVAKALTLGVFLMLIGLWLYLEEPQAALKIILIIFFQMVTIPVASHLVGLFALEKKLPRWKQTPIDHKSDSDESD